MRLFDELEEIIEKPAPFAHYTTPEFWNDPDISKGMLEAHLNPNHDAASYRGTVIRQAVDWIATRFAISEGIRICDFGCGPGLYTTEFAQLGAKVTGIDVSERSLTYARTIANQKHLAIDYVRQNYLHFSTDERYDLITMISRDFPVLNPTQRKTLLETFCAILDDKGAIVLDADSTKRFANVKETTTYEFFPKGGFWSSEPYHLFQCNFTYEKEMVLLEKYTLIEQDRRREFFNWHQCYSLQSLNDLLEENGFQIEEYYSTIAGDPYEEDSEVITVIARKANSAA